MPIKKVKYSGVNTANTNYPLINTTIDPTDGVVVETPADWDFELEPYTAEFTNEHSVNESNNIIWNAISFENYLTSTSHVEGTEPTINVNIYGADNTGQKKLIMEKEYTPDTSTYDYNIDLSHSSCASPLQFYDTTASTGTIEIFPTILSQTEEMKLNPIWFDSNWGKRKRLGITRPITYTYSTNFNYPGSAFIIKVDYEAEMETDFTDVRFVGADASTEIPFYKITHTDSTDALFLVFIPWQSAFAKPELFFTKTPTTFTNVDMNYVYMYYDNSSASDSSDITLDGNMAFYETFPGASFDSKWTATEPAGTSATVTGGTARLRVDSGTTTATVLISADLPYEDDFLDTFRGSIIIEMSRDGTTAKIGRFRLSKDSNNYVAMNARYVTSAWYWQTQSTVGGAFTNYELHRISTPADDFRFIRFDVTADKKIKFYASPDGYSWDYINEVTPTSGQAPNTLEIRLESTASNAGDVDMYISNVFMVEHGRSTYDWIESFTNGNINTGRWTTSLGNGTITEGSGNIRFQVTAGSTAYYSPMVKTAPIMYSASNISSGYDEGWIIETKVNSMDTTDSNFAGILLYKDGNNLLRFVISEEGHLILDSLVNNSDGEFESTAANEYSLPCYLRVVKDPVNKYIYCDASSDGNVWDRKFRAPYNTYQTWSKVGLIAENAITTAKVDTIFEYVKVMRGPELAGQANTFQNTETCTDYPITGTKGTETFSFNFPDNLPTHTQILTKEYGEDHKTSRTLKIKGMDRYILGPDGMDKYKKIITQIKISFNAEGTANFPSLEYKYEV